MTILASLARAYERLPDAPPFGYATEKIGFCVILTPNGDVAHVVDHRSIDGKRNPESMIVPACPKRSGQTPRPNFLWDNINYSLGAGKLSDKNDKRFDAFRDKHLAYLSDLKDSEIEAFCAFLRKWDPPDVLRHFPAGDLPTSGIVFASSGSYRDHFLHQNPAARSVWERVRLSWVTVEGKSAAPAICLVSGASSEIARTHPPIKGMSGFGGKSEMALVSFNDDSYESYGHSQGDNAPVSEAAAFAYTTALNTFLAKGSRNRIQIGDASTVFWADASDAETAEAAVETYGGWFDTSIDEGIQSERVRAVLEGLRKGRPLGELDPQLEAGVRFYVLGLAPNAARISIRFWFESDFADLARNYQRFTADMDIEPPPRNPFPPIWQYLVETAVLKKRENVPPYLAGEWMRAILTGNRYPLTLLTTVLMRIRADGEVNALRAALLKAVLTRNFERKDTPVALDPDFKDKGYLLGRLFAVYERIQEAALGRSVNATIKDKFYGSASAQPRKVFSAIDRNSANHLSKVAKQAPGYKVTLERTLSDIMGSLSPADDPFPASLSAQEQALFGLGYYHQRSAFFQSSDKDASETAQ
ncbi:CRISPR-associated protein, Csd1 family [Hyphomonas polymorpha PS728]|uniref:CRISPR-associated protein, Csd1 family n=1 Tax=Hyphomonas polymorpha PS728 TaxID=1280954 RepID=A0A062VH04_9PROT|nr:type I-C CRISPR-associated protein Cas8c/Csd1 [Hyphomonas polymorpha]KCZ98774.1 CRISPR-associated protein, Csd1 family [Hyphomonas polymorpha PS728]